MRTQQPIEITRQRDDAQGVTSYTYRVSDALLEANSITLIGTLEDARRRIADLIAQDYIERNGQVVLAMISEGAVANLTAIAAGRMLGAFVGTVASTGEKR